MVREQEDGQTKGMEDRWSGSRRPGGQKTGGRIAMRQEAGGQGV
jgi:hypothetical protein